MERPTTSRGLRHRVELCALVIFTYFLVGILPVQAFNANLAANPNPNTGDFDVTWSNPQTKYYTLQELPSGGSWTDIIFTNGTSHSFTGHASGVFSYRLKRVDVECSGWPEPECFEVTTYSETIVVTVDDPPAGGGGTGDPFPPPGTFTPPDDSDFPDATITGTGAPSGDNNVGALKGIGGVSGGQASYSIPIVVPPGRKGMQPSISLNYSSSSGNGVVGVGWSLSATSAVTRCSATPATDGFTAAPQYDENRDRLCLDGQRLVAETGSSYGTSGAKYRTELDAFVRVTQNGSLNGTNTSFTAEYKNGRTSTFGGTLDSRHTAPPVTAILTWAISKTEDPSGNTITYEYSAHGTGEHLVSDIHYTGYGAVDGDRHVSFNYEPRIDRRSYYQAGGKTQVTQRLKEIRTKYQSTTVRTYTLGYSASLSTGRDLLRDVTECGYEGATPRCLPATDFEWQEKATDYVDAAEVEFFSAGSPVKVHDFENGLHNILPRGDTNGDGVKDWDGYQINAEGEIISTDSIELHTCYKRPNSYGLVCLTGEFNADGRTDSFRQNNDKFEISYAVDQGQTPTWINTGLDWRGGLPVNSDSPLGFADFNGDGWLDVAFRNGLVLNVYFHSKNVNAPFSTGSKQQISSYSSNGSGGLNQDIQIYGDMDGNGTPDFVRSTVPGENSTPGMPRPDTIYLTHSQSGGGMTTTTRSVPYDTTSLVNGNIVHDINSDGLPDVISLSSIGGTLKFKLNDGTSFDSNWTSLSGVSLPTRHGTYILNPQTGEEEQYETFAMSKILVMDYDGDGREEILFAGSDAGDILASGCAEIQQTDPPGPVWKCDDGLYTDIQDAYTEVGGPINADVLDNSVRRYRAIQFGEGGSGNVTATEILTDIVASASQAAAIDATGDGLPDVVTAFGCRTTPCEFNLQTTGRTGAIQNSTYANEGAWFNRNLGSTTDNPSNAVFEFAANDLMSAAEDAFGSRHEWTYRPLSSDEYDAPESEYYHTVHNYQSSDTDYFHFASSMYVVAEHAASDGVGGLNDTLYRYRGAIFNNKGRGFQGFRAIEVEENIGDGKDKISRTEFHQKWPTSSIVERACTWLASDTIQDLSLPEDPNPWCSDVGLSSKLLSDIVTDSIHDVATTGGARFVAVKKQTTKAHDLVTRDLLTTKIVDRTFDAYGNVTYESNQHDDDWGIHHTETTTVFHAPSGWWLDKIDYRDVKYNPVAARHASTPAITAGTDDVKIVTTDFVLYDSAHRLPSEVKITANDTPLWSQVNTTYNTYGLPTQISTTGTDVTGPRTVDTTYSKDGVTLATDGYFPYTITNALGHEIEQHTDPKHGVPTSHWDANNLLTVTAHDAFGRIEEQAPPGAPTVYYRYSWCDGSPWCHAGTTYRLEVDSAGAPRNLVYFDSFGRDQFNMVRNFQDSNWVRVRTDYDERGNVTRKTQPFDPANGDPSNKGTRFTGYDAFGRLTSKETDQANAQVLKTTYTYSGFTTNINVNYGSILMHRIHNGLGQLVETKDGEGGFTRYAYDGAGNPILMQDPVMIGRQGPSGRPMAIVAEFNALGHKEWVEDPDWWNGTSDYGRKTFTTNGLGEVLSETDPNGNLIELDYDELGRMTHRTVNSELEGLWVFDNTDTHKGLGLLDYEDSQFRNDGSRLQKFYYYSSAATGRKDLLQVKQRFYENDDQNDFDEFDVDYFADGFYARPKGLRYPGGTSLALIYDNQGNLIEEKDPLSSVVYRQITDIGTRGRIESANIGSHGQGYEYSFVATFFARTGQADTISVNNGTTLDLAYTYDIYGNLQTRTNGISNISETLGYDLTQRMTSSLRSSNGNFPVLVSYGYDPAGNIQTKSDYRHTASDHVSATYVLDSQRPHVLKQLDLEDSSTVLFSHDDNGNVTAGDGEDIAYTAFNKPARIDAQGSSNWMEFQYGADLMRYRQEKDDGKITYYLDKLMEIVTVGTSTDYRHYLSDVAILTKTGSLNDPNPGIRYLLRDRLGGVATIADETGLNVEARGYDPFGKPRNSDWSDKPTPTINSSITDRGFTDHEHLDEWQLIHMNGRAFDYNLGRFLSVDPIIQAPGNSQSMNGYAYIMNNPLSGTDPSGYCSMTDSAKACADSMESGEIRAVTDENGDVAGYVGKTDDGSLIVTDNGTAFGEAAVTVALHVANNGSEISDFNQLGGTSAPSFIIGDGHNVAWVGISRQSGRPMGVECWMCPARDLFTGKVDQLDHTSPLEQMAEQLVEFKRAQREGDTIAQANAAAGFVAFAALYVAIEGVGRLPSGKVPKLPDYDGKTSGTLYTNEGDIVNLRSGGGDPTYSNYAGFNHVEGKAAIEIRKRASSGGELYINHPKGICNWCNSSIAYLLPKGSRLRVVPLPNTPPRARWKSDPTEYVGNGNLKPKD